MLLQKAFLLSCNLRRVRTLQAFLINKNNAMPVGGSIQINPREKKKGLKL
jgi:hypothetical protein